LEQLCQPFEDKIDRVGSEQQDTIGPARRKARSCAEQVGAEQHEQCIVILREGSMLPA
jgi:hypothetical protein